MDNLLEIKNLFVEYVSDKNAFGGKQIIRAVNGVSLDVKKGEILAIAGESGCGKSTLARAILRLENSKSGEIDFEGKNILKFNSAELKKYRQNAQMIFQNPYASLNPKMKVSEILKEPLQINTKFSNKEIDKIIDEKLEQVGLSNEVLKLYPHEFSGGQRQRIAIARALVLSPKFIVADEPVSALDVSIQAQIINLLKELKDNFNLTLILITHDMSVIKYLADRVAVMYLGEIVEVGRCNEIFTAPKHPYTQALLSAVPQLVEDEKDRIVLSGELPSPSNLPVGCKFHTRCRKCFERCSVDVPPYVKLSDTHFVKCFLYK